MSVSVSSRPRVLSSSRCTSARNVSIASRSGMSSERALSGGPTYTAPCTRWGRAGSVRPPAAPGRGLRTGPARRTAHTSTWRRKRTNRFSLLVCLFRQIGSNTPVLASKALQCRQDGTLRSTSVCSSGPKSQMHCEITTRKKYDPRARERGGMRRDYLVSSLQRDRRILFFLSGSGNEKDLVGVPPGDECFPSLSFPFSFPAAR